MSVLRDIVPANMHSGAEYPLYENMRVQCIMTSRKQKTVNDKEQM
jgi:hypothetical protein